MKQSILLLACGASCGLLAAAEPAWWTATSPVNTSIKSGAPPNNRGPVKLGQLKNTAKKASLYLDHSLPGFGAGARIHAMVAGFHPTVGNHSPVNLGQLKAVAKPFYDRMRVFGFDTKASLQGHGAPGWAHDYPWDPATPKSVNLAPANLGQLKWVFSFDLSGLVVADTDGDGLPDAWETKWGFDPDDPDDGPESDVDSDGLPDVWEIRWGMDPANDDENGNGVSDCFEDFDGDGLSNQLEALLGSNPFSKDTDGDGMPDDWEMAHDFNIADPADATQDTDLDGDTNLVEYQNGSNPLDYVEPDHQRKVELWRKRTWQFWNAQTHSWDPPVTESWWPVIWLGPVTPQETYWNWSAGLKELSTSRASWRMRTEFYFKNVGPRPVPLRWKESFRQSSQAHPKRLTGHEYILWTQSPVYTRDYPSLGENIDFVEVEAIAASEDNGFDNFERYVPSPGQMPDILPQPWQMVYGGVGEVKTVMIDWKLAGEPPLLLETSASSLDVTPDQIDSLEEGMQDPLEVTLYGDAGTSDNFDEYLNVTGLEAPAPENKVKLLRAARFEKIVHTVQIYEITCTYADGKPPIPPTSVPTPAQLQTYLNEVFGRQMNVEFTVNGNVIRKSIQFDVGHPGTAFEDINGPGPDRSNGELNLAASTDVEDYTDEQKAVLDSTHYNPNLADAAVFFVGTPIFTHDASSKGACMGGTAAQHRWSIIQAIEKPYMDAKFPDYTMKQLLKTCAHEIGHMDMGTRGKGLHHPRHPKTQGIVPRVDPNNPGFPLLRLSDDMKRLMQSPGGPEGTLLIKEEWFRYRSGDSGPQ